MAMGRIFAEQYASGSSSCMWVSYILVEKEEILLRLPLSVVKTWWKSGYTDRETMSHSS